MLLVTYDFPPYCFCDDVLLCPGSHENDAGVPGRLPVVYFSPRNLINPDDVITFWLSLMNKMRRNLIKIRSCTIIVGLIGFKGF